MRNIWTIYRREISSYFNSPIAYIFIILFLAMMAFMFFVVNGFFAQTMPDIRGYYGILPWVFAIFIPAVTMRLWSEEKRAGTIELLMTMPIRSWEVVVGKYLAGYTVILLSLALTIFVPLSLELVLDLDWGVVMSTYVGALVIASVYIALGAWISTFTHNQIVALLVAVAFSFLLSLVGVQPVIVYLNRFPLGDLGSLLGWFGTFYHYQEFTRGLVNPVGFVYAASVTAFFLTLNNVFVEGRKY